MPEAVHLDAASLASHMPEKNELNLAFEMQSARQKAQILRVCQSLSTKNGGRQGERKKKRDFDQVKCTNNEDRKF